MTTFDWFIALLVVICLLSWIPRSTAPGQPAQRLFVLPNIQYILTCVLIFFACVWLYHRM